MTTLWRAANDDHVFQGASFAEERASAELYLDNPGYGGHNLYKIVIDDSPGDDTVLDWRKMTTRRAAEYLGVADPCAIGLDEWLAGSANLQPLRDEGYLWVRVTESYPPGSVTWIWTGGVDDEEPELILVSRGQSTAKSKKKRLMR